MNDIKNKIMIERSAIERAMVQQGISKDFIEKISLDIYSAIRQISKDSILETKKIIRNSLNDISVINTIWEE